MDGICVHLLYKTCSGTPPSADAMHAESIPARPSTG